METDQTVFHPDPVSISPHSRATCMLEMLRLDSEGNEIASARASGFLWYHNATYFIFTNWHVASGLNPDTGMLLGTFIPNAMRVNFFSERSATPEEVAGHWVLGAGSHTFNLDPNDPLAGWLLHPLGKAVDLVALPFKWEVETEFKPVCLNLTRINDVASISIGDELFVVGYPEGTQFERRQPLWKRATVATDPALGQKGLPLYYVDTVGNSGLSGSPVLHRIQYLTSHGPDKSKAARHEAEFSVAGVYCGRLGDKGIHSQIGRVIRAEAISDIVKARIPQQK